MRLAARTLLTPICCLGLTFATAAGASDAFVNDAIHELDFEITQKADLQSGEVISVGLPFSERQPTELMVGAAMMVVRRPLADVSQALLGEDTFHVDTEILDFGTIGDESASREQIAQIFRGIGYSEAESDEASQLLQAKPGTHFNLSQSEIDQFNALQVDGPVHEQVSEALADMLQRRFLDYLDGGLGAVEDYARTRGRSASPRKELTTAFDSLTLVEKHFPSFHESLTGFPAQVPADTANRFYWIKRAAGKRPALFALSHRMAELKGDYTVAMDLQFYAQHSYNSKLTLLACLPVEEGTLVMSAIRVYTDQVTGFASGTKKEIGRKRLADAMASYFREVRQVLEGQ